MSLDWGGLRELSVVTTKLPHKLDSNGKLVL